MIQSISVMYLLQRAFDGSVTSRHNERGWETVSFSRSFIQWILYIGAKYQKLQRLALQDIHLQTLDEIVIGPLLTAVSKLAHLRSYSVQICSLSRQLVEAMTANNLQSDDLGFILQENDPINETFDSLRLSTSFSTLASITLVCYPGVSLPLLCQTPVPLFNISGHLTRLTLTYYDDSAEHSTGLFINILQNQAALESLYFRFMTMKEDSYSVLSRQVPDIRRGRIKSIKLRINAIGGEQNAAENLNRIFNFTLQSCPLLKIFRLFCASSIRSRGAINLDFTRHQYLQEIEFDIKSILYFWS